MSTNSSADYSPEDFGGAKTRCLVVTGRGRGCGEKRFVVDDLGMRIEDFTLDPSQDLIVPLEYRPAPGSSFMAATDICVHLRETLRYRCSPPSCEEPHAVSTTCYWIRAWMYDTDCRGYFWMPFYAVFTWNWMSGEKLLVRLNHLSILILSRGTLLHSLYKRIKLQNAFTSLSCTTI